MLLYNRIAKQRFNCNDNFDKKLMKNFLSFELQIKYLLKNHKFKETKIEFLHRRLNEITYIQQEKKQIQICMTLEKGE